MSFAARVMSRSTLNYKAFKLVRPFPRMASTLASPVKAQQAQAVKKAGLLCEQWRCELTWARRLVGKSSFPTKPILSSCSSPRWYRTELVRVSTTFVTTSNRCVPFLSIFPEFELQLIPPRLPASSNAITIRTSCPEASLARLVIFCNAAQLRRLSSHCPTLHCLSQPSEIAS